MDAAENRDTERSVWVSAHALASGSQLPLGLHELFVGGLGGLPLLLIPWRKWVPCPRHFPAGDSAPRRQGERGVRGWDHFHTLLATGDRLPRKVDGRPWLMGHKTCSSQWNPSNSSQANLRRTPVLRQQHFGGSNVRALVDRPLKGSTLRKGPTNPRPPHSGAPAKSQPLAFGSGYFGLSPCTTKCP